MSDAIKSMKQRTTIELSREHKAKLVSLAAKRGAKGYSEIIDEALELYFREDGQVAAREKIIHGALALEGTMGIKEGEEFSAQVCCIRSRWR